MNTIDPVAGSSKVIECLPGHGRAVVIGASIAGLMAARVLSEHFAEVCVLERDALPEDAAPRKGTPQAIHPHGLLARGREVMEQLFPGFTEALVAQGALTGDVGLDVAFDADAKRLARPRTGCLGVLAGRLAIEAELRRRTRALPGVRMITGVDVREPVYEPAAGRVTGVRYGRCSPAADSRTLTADLVLDCSGRGSHSPGWLDAWGYEPPAEERVKIDLSYTSAYFARDSRERPLTAGVISTATPGLPRPAVLLAQEPGADGRPRWVAGVGGYAGDHPEALIEGMRTRAREIGGAEIIDLAERGELLGPVMRYRFPHSQRRHFERLSRFPGGFLVMGDALASFNPIYGQGMTVAACEALALREALKAGLHGLAPRFFKAASKVIDIPWQLAVGGDLALPVVPGPRPLPVRIVNAYIGRLYRAAVRDAAVAGAFLRVVHLIDKPPSLFAPRVLWRVMLRGGRRPGADAVARVELAARRQVVRPDIG